jgi:EAL domain-containing protein (putative c-di-GMP-specific phosphodiesterase class I)
MDRQRGADSLPAQNGKEMHMTRRTCDGCKDGIEPPFDFTMAFQPIVDLSAGRIWGYEALVRGPDGQAANAILDRVDAANRYSFDQSCRVRAIELAGRLFPRGETLKLSINFMPNAVYQPAACIRTSLAAAGRVGFPHDRIMFEFLEDEEVADASHIAGIVNEYHRLGFLTAIDDFGSGYSGLRLLARLSPNLIKLDMQIIRGIDSDPRRRAIVAGVLSMASALGIDVIAEGVETGAEVSVLRAAGIDLFQGFYFARPAVEALPEVAPVFGRPSALRAS